MSRAGPSILVGIVTCNRAGILPKSIESALRQKGGRTVISVFDNASTDGTALLAQRYPGVEWLRSDENRGYMGPRNEWMKREGIDYFVSLDDDSWFLGDDEISVALDFLEKHEGVAALAFDILSPARPALVKRVPAQEAGIFVGCGHVLRLRSLPQVGYYEPVPGAYGGEERDLSLRLIDAGYQIVRLPGVHVWHERSDVARDSAQQKRSDICNDLVMVVRRVPGWMVPLALGHKLRAHFQDCRKAGRLADYRAGIGMFLRYLPGCLRSRRAVRVSTVLTYRRRTLEAPVV